MHREVKIGMSVLLVLLIGLGGAIAYRVRQWRQAPMSKADASVATAPNLKEPTVRGGANQPTLLKTGPANAAPPGARAASIKPLPHHADEAEAPHPSYIPKARDADDRYAAARPIGATYQAEVPADDAQTVRTPAPALSDDPLPGNSPASGNAAASGETAFSGGLPTEANEPEPRPLGQPSARFLPGAGEQSAAQHAPTPSNPLPGKLPPSVDGLPSAEQSYSADPVPGGDEGRLVVGREALDVAASPAGASLAAQQPEAGIRYRQQAPVSQSPSQLPYRPGPSAAAQNERAPSNFHIPPAQAATVERANTGTYVVEPGDSFWTISKKVYGDGGFFKALIEFNRARFPTPGRLKIGDELLTPSETELREKYSGLCPKPRAVAAGTSQVAPLVANRGTSVRTYLVEEGDTLFDIARHELGSGRRWPEIYRLNRHVLADDIDYLRPGIELILPTSPQIQGEALSNQPGQSLRR